MLKKLFLLIIFVGFSKLSAQETKSLYQTKKVAVSTDTISIEKVSINSGFFKMQLADGTPIDTSFYKIDFKNSINRFEITFKMACIVVEKY